MPDTPSVSRSRGDEALRATMTSTPDGAWVHLEGELDLATAADAEAAIASAAALAERVTLDLRGLDFIDSAGISLLVTAHRRARQDGSALTVVACDGPVVRLLELCGLDRELTIVEDRALEARA